MAILSMVDSRMLSVSLIISYYAYTKALPMSRVRVVLLEIPFWIALFVLVDSNIFGSNVFRFFVIIHILWRYNRSTGRDQAVDGAVFITGCDSGMGLTTARHLAKVGYHVFAGCYSKDSFSQYEDDADCSNITPLVINVKDEKSVKQAANFVQQQIDSSKGRISGLYGVLQCAGISYVAPFEYIPMDMFKDQIEVSTVGS